MAAIVVADKKAIANISSTHVLLTAAENKLSVLATDLDVEVIIEQELETIEVSGAFVVPLRKVVEICKAMAGDVVLNIASSVSDTHKLKIKAKKSFLAVNCLAEEVFPALGQRVFEAEFSINIKLLKNLINNTGFAMGNDDSRVFLNGLFFEFAGQKARAVAADGHRLMVWESTEQQYHEGVVDLTEDLNFLMPRKSVSDLSRLIAATEMSDNLFAKVFVGGHHVRVVINNITYTSKLLSGGFPPFKNLIPQATKSTLTVDREEFKKVCQRAIALLGDSDQAVRLNFCQKSLEISGKNDAEDLIQESIAANMQGEEKELCFNVGYLLDFLTNIEGKKIVFKAGEYNSGSLMQSEEQPSYYVIMPMQI